MPAQIPAMILSQIMKSMAQAGAKGASAAKTGIKAAGSTAKNVGYQGKRLTELAAKGTRERAVSFVAEWKPKVGNAAKTIKGKLSDSAARMLAKAKSSASEVSDSAARMLAKAKSSASEVNGEVDGVAKKSGVGKAILSRLGEMRDRLVDIFTIEKQGIEADREIADKESSEKRSLLERLGFRRSEEKKEKKPMGAFREGFQGKAKEGLSTDLGLMGLLIGLGAILTALKDAVGGLTDWAKNAWNIIKKHPLIEGASEVYGGAVDAAKAVEEKEPGQIGKEKKGLIVGGGIGLVATQLTSEERRSQYKHGIAAAAEQAKSYLKGETKEEREARRMKNVGKGVNIGNRDVAREANKALYSYKKINTEKKKDWEKWEKENPNKTYAEWEKERGRFFKLGSDGEVIRPPKSTAGSFIKSAFKAAASGKKDSDLKPTTQEGERETGDLRNKSLAKNSTSNKVVVVNSPTQNINNGGGAEKPDVTISAPSGNPDRTYVYIDHMGRRINVTD